MNNTNNLLQINNLHFRWPNSQRGVLNIPCLEIHQGERIFLSGESGSGKTTLLSLIGGLHTPQKGNIKVLNQTLDTLNQSQRDQFRADHVGVLEKTGTPVDRTIHISLKGVTALHIDWQTGTQARQSVSAQDALKMDLQPKQITAFMFGLKSKMAIFKFQVSTRN